MTKLERILTRTRWILEAFEVTPSVWTTNLSRETLQTTARQVESSGVNVGYVRAAMRRISRSFFDSLILVRSVLSRTGQRKTGKSKGHHETCSSRSSSCSNLSSNGGHFRAKPVPTLCVPLGFVLVQLRIRSIRDVPQMDE